MVLSKTGMWLAAALGLSAAVVAGFVMFTSGKAGGVNLTSASLVPADAGVYVAFNTDLKSPQWVAAFDLIERLGEDDPEGQLRESAEEDGDLDWEEDVQPFLGGNAAVYVNSFDAMSFEVHGAVIAKVNDGDRVLEVIEEEGHFDLHEESFMETTFFSTDNGQVWVAIIDGHLVMTMSEASMLDVIEVAKGEKKSLAGDADFVALRDELETDFIGFVYVNMDQMLTEMAGGEALSEALDEAGADLALAPMAGVIGAKKDGFVFQAAGGGDPGIAAAMLEPRISRYATMVPADTAVFVSTYGLADAFDEMLDEAGDELDEALGANSPWPSVGDLLDELGEEAGVGSLQEVIGLFDGETAVAIWFPDGSEESAEGALMTEVANVADARDVIDRLVDEPETVFEEVNGVPFWTNGEGDAIALSGSDLFIGTEDAVRRLLAGAGEALEESVQYRRTVATLPTSTGTFGFVDMSSVLRLAAGGIPAELDEAEQALDAFIINWVTERGLARVNGALTVQPE